MLELLRDFDGASLRDLSGTIPANAGPLRDQCGTFAGLSGISVRDCGTCGTPFRGPAGFRKLIGDRFAS